MNATTPARAAGKRRYPLEFRLRCLRALFSPQRPPKSKFSRRVRLYSARFGVSAATVWRWIKCYREGGPNALRDKLRSDALTRRAPVNVISVTPGAPVRLPLETAESRPTRLSL
jgi:transposase-like protein